MVGVTGLEDLGNCEGVTGLAVARRYSSAALVATTKATIIMDRVCRRAQSHCMMDG